MSYLPHFLSWIVIFGILLGLLSPSTVLVNNAISNAGGQPIGFLSDPHWFRIIVVSSDIWKETGWGAILYLAALLAVLLAAPLSFRAPCGEPEPPPKPKQVRRPELKVS